eukprot:CAMPEP_0185018932 /NCGR_PEP_ID=MMETSP1103-20130426/1595_1 /TAXON_ID=36769 /ORGANISM="Paraphysomonas bandaiensis, Strain Caron Lab Isolate" /LENGTH=248 /DNA_ID=CAMNT_0027548985 /DNA_START=70 /DNA_END=816 /DNA_ORIENTATION=+
MMLRLIISVLGTLAIAPYTVTAHRYGVDLSVATNEDTWQCLMKEKNTSYAIVRAYRSIGELDENAAQSIIAANSAGIRDLHAYIFPCVSSSSYSQKNGIECESPSEQLRSTIDYLEKNGITVLRQNSVEASGPVVRRLWLDVEDEDPSTYYDSDPAVNQKVLDEFATAAASEGVFLGIYTTMTYWTNIMGGVEGYSQYPLWYPRYDAEDSMDFFEPFAGWEDVLIKQTGGDVGFCGITQVDSDYMEAV